MNVLSYLVQILLTLEYRSHNDHFSVVQIKLLVDKEKQWVKTDATIEFYGKNPFRIVCIYPSKPFGKNFKILKIFEIQVWHNL